jgi:hypothetical protein
MGYFKVKFTLYHTSTIDKKKRKMIMTRIRKGKEKIKGYFFTQK